MLRSKFPGTFGKVRTDGRIPRILKPKGYLAIISLIVSLEKVGCS
jgi:hypothetical protein